jgi:hypothetical protein
MRLTVLERELGKWLSLPPKQPRRRRLTKKEVAELAVDGYLERLYSLSERQGEERKRAKELLAESSSTPSEQLAQHILEWTEQLLVSRAGASGQRMFRWLRARAPEELGKAYALYRVFSREDWSWEDLAEEYEYSRRG